MILLGFDTSTPATAVGLLLPDGSVVQARDDPREGDRPGHATRLLALAADLLADAGLRFTDLGHIAVGVGPGTFTGLRVGVSTARGLAQSLDVELVGVSSLRALAVAATPGWEPASAESPTAGGAPTPDSPSPIDVLAVLDARRGEAFVAAYTNGRELAPPRALAPQDLGVVLTEATSAEPLLRWIAVGDGAVRFRAELQTLGVEVAPDDSPLHRVTGRAICELGIVASAQPLETVVPDYCRRPDAEIARAEIARAEIARDVKAPVGASKSEGPPAGARAGAGTPS
jgi:tRNA threonylcarbamoyladenosine biosynthesis protein TsaB